MFLCSQFAFILLPLMKRSVNYSHTQSCVPNDHLDMFLFEYVSVCVSPSVFVVVNWKLYLSVLKWSSA